MPSRISLRARSGVVMGVKPSAMQHVQGVALQGQFQQHGLVLEEVEAVPGHAGAALEVDQVELLAELDVVQRLEVELRQRASCRGTARGWPCRPRRPGRRGATGWGSCGGSPRPRRRSASSSASAPRRSARGAGGLLPCGPRARPASLALPIDLETSLAWRLSSSTCGLQRFALGSPAGRSGPRRP